MHPKTCRECRFRGYRTGTKRPQKRKQREFEEIYSRKNFMVMISGLMRTWNKKACFTEPVVLSAISSRLETGEIELVYAYHFQG
jgi:hypothetical protein